MTSPSPKHGTDLLEFCLKPWVAFDEDDVTEEHGATAGKVASLLISAKRFHILDRFISGIPDNVLGVFLKNEQFQRALIDLRRCQGRYEDIYQLIENGSFSDGSDLLTVWDEAHYAMWQREYGKPLSALTKFRIRKKNPPPPSICQDGRPTRNLDSNARAVLMDWLKDHQDYPYPKVTDREQLTKATGLTHTQIKTWFANARRRKQNLKELKQKRDGTEESKAKKMTKTNTSSVGKSSGTAESHVECPENSPRYLAPSPGVFRTSEPTGLQGLLCMYNKLTAQKPLVPGLPHPLDHEYNARYGFSPSCNQHLPYHKNYTPSCVHSPTILSETTTKPAVHQIHKLNSGESRGKQNSGCNFACPVLHSIMKTPGHSNETGQTWNSVTSPSAMREQEFVFTRQPHFSDPIHAMMSPSQSAQFTSRTGVRTPAMATSTFTAASSPMLSQYQDRDLRVVTLPADSVSMSRSPASVGLDMLGGGSPLIHDQCLAMWNTSSWFFAHSPQRSQTCELERMEHASDVLHTHCVNEKQKEEPSVLSIPHTGELIRPYSLDSCLVLQPTRSPDLGVVQPTDIPQTLFSPHSLVNASAEDVDEAALILLDLATTKPCLP